MSVKFDTLNLTFKDEVKQIKINDIEVNVKQYLSVEDKVNLVQIALQQAMVNNMYDEALIEAYFYTYMLIYYTDLEFTDEQKAEPLKIYDLIESNGILEEFLNAVPEDEFHDLFQYLKEQKEINMTYQTSLSFTINQFLNQFFETAKNLNPKDWEKISEIVKQKLNEE